MMFESQSPKTKSGSPSSIKHIFNCQAYRLKANKWSKLQKFYIGCDLEEGKTLKQITKVKIKGQKGYDNTHIVKVTLSSRDQFYSMSQQLQLQWFLHIISQKVAQLSPSITSNEPNQFINVCSGIILKKSGIISNWQKNFVMITRDGLTSSIEQKGKVEIQIEKVKEIWTRFEIIEGGTFFVFKLRNFFKYQFGVPIHNVLKWGKALYSLIDFQ